MSPELYQYLLRVGVREHAALTKLRNLTEQHTYARMASPPDEGALIAFLLRLIGAKVHAPPPLLHQPPNLSRPSIL
jgi:predicted O-methyltransferase YrrM